MKRTFPTIMLLLPLLASCVWQETSGRLELVSSKDRQSYTELAKTFENLRLSSTELQRPLALLSTPEGPSLFRGKDLILDEMDASFGLAKSQGLLAKIAAHYSLTFFSKNYTLKPFRSPVFAKTESIPVAATYYALWYDADMLASLNMNFPADWDSLLKDADGFKRSGVSAISLGAAYGRQLALWYAYADLSLNGIEAYKQRVSGTRTFNESGSRSAFDAVIALYRSGAIIKDSGRKTSQDAWTDLLEGRAAFCLMDSSAIDRIPAGRNIKAMPVPPVQAGVKGGVRATRHGELSLVSSFFIPSSSSNPRGAQSFARKFASSGAPGLADGRSRIGVVLDRQQAKSLSPGQAILDAADTLAPPLDRALGDQYSYDAMALFAELAKELDANAGQADSESWAARLEALR